MKMTKPWLCLIITMSLANIAFSQTKHTISGFIEDNTNGERMLGATIYDLKTLKGTTSNIYGFYSLTLPKGPHQIVYSYVGFQADTVAMELNQDISRTVAMRSSLALKEVEIVASQQDKIQESTQMSVAEMSVKEIKKIPVLMGESDVLKAIQLLPGVQSGGEGTSGLYVRGGGPDQNLILLDGVPVYNASHLFGFFSVFNSDALSGVRLIKGGFPARYAGRLSSVLDIRMKEGNNKEFHGEGGIGLIASRLTLEGPIIKDKTSFVISGRRTYIDLLARPLIKRAGKKDGIDLRAGYFFWDGNAKINHKINEKNRLFLSAYMGRDKGFADIGESFEFGRESGTSEQKIRLDWGNLTTALRWNSIINPKLFVNTTLTYSNYDFVIGQGVKESTTTTRLGQSDSTASSEFSFDYTSGIYDVAGRVDFDWLPNPNHYVKFGLGNIYHTFTPGVSAFKIKDNSADTTANLGASKVFAHEYSVYVEDDVKIGGRFKMNPGINYSGFVVRGKHYTSIQPRFAARFLLDEKTSIKASYARMSQFIHLLSNAGIGLPTDLWVPATDSIEPEHSHQIALGVARELPWGLEVSVEGYYKTMQNLIEYKEGASFINTNDEWDQKVTSGDGESYGGEIFFQKKNGKTTGWVGYTLSWTNRTFPEVNFGETFAYRYDRRHDIAVVCIHEFSKKFDIGATWVYGSGNTVTLPFQKYAGVQTAFERQFNEPSADIQHFTSRNNFRMKAYHRLDIGLNFNKETKWGQRTWSVGTYNTYNRRNPFFIYEDVDSQGKPAFKRLSLFPVIPYVTFSFKF